MARDPRTKKYKLDYIVEVDAFLGLAPDTFKELIRSTITQYRNDKIASDVRKENLDLINEGKLILNTAKPQAKEVLVSQITGGFM